MTGKRVVLDRVVVAREQRVAASDQVDVTVDHSVVQRRNGDRRRERVVGPEDVERGERDEQLLIARRDHREVGVERGHGHTVDRDRGTRPIADEREHRVDRDPQLGRARRGAQR